MSTPSRNEKTAHLVWCALIALLTARQDGRVRTEQQENIFLIRWLADAERQRRFSRDVATDISWLLKQGRTLGLRARLRQKLDYIWRSSTGDIMEQTDLFRLTWGLETAKNEFWLYQLLSDPEWRKQNTAQINSGVNAIFILKSALQTAFEECGKQIAPLPVRPFGNVRGLSRLLATCGWQLQEKANGDSHLIAVKK